MRKWDWVALIAIASFSLVNMYFFNSKPIHQLGGDQISYNQIALNVLHGHGFTQSTAAPYEPTILRTPAYPLFIAAVYLFAGEQNFEAVRLMQILLMLALSFMVFCLSFAVFANKPLSYLSLIGITICGFDYYSGIGVYGYLFTETLTIFFITAAVFQAVLARQRGRMIHFVLTGLLLSLAMLTRPANMLFPFALLLFIVPLKNLRHSIPHLLVFGMITIATVAPWTIRNYLCFNRFIALSAPLDGLMVLSGAIINNPDFIPYPDSDFSTNGVTFAEPELTEIKEGIRDLYINATTIKVFDYDRKLRDIGIRIIKRDPVAFVQRWFYRMLGHWHMGDLANCINGIDRHVSLMRVALMGLKLGATAIILLSFAFFWRNPFYIILTLFPITNTLLYTAFTPQLRYAMPSYALVIILAAASCLVLCYHFISHVPNRTLKTWAQNGLTQLRSTQGT